MLRFIVGVVLLNGALGAVNSWPTAWVRPARLLAPELLLLVLVVALLVALRGRFREIWRWVATLVALLLVVGRYGVVTTEGLFGRPVNLYWEAVRLPDVVALMLDGAPVGMLVAGAVGGSVAALALVLATRWCVGAVADSVEGPRFRAWVVVICVLLLGGYFWQPKSESEVVFARATAPAYGRQIALVINHMLNPRLKAMKVPTVDISEAGPRRDVYVVFFESYGAAVFDNPLRMAALRTAYDDVEAVLEGSSWSAVSAFVNSTTFGGASWLAHGSLLSGQRIMDQRDYLTLIESGEALLPHRFGAAGYRTIALVPGITKAWPEGAAFGYDLIYDAHTIGYNGPRFGWWEIPDQYSLAHLQEQEADQPGRAPLFVLYPTVMSHMPFAPTPPYVEDWEGLAEAYRRTGMQDQPVDRREAYTGAVRYNLEVLAGFLRQRADDDAVVIVLGDHQPPALVTGPNASWAVPVHVFSRDRQALDGFETLGFQPGVRPGKAVVGNIADLTVAVAASAGS